MGENADLRNPTDHELPADVLSQVEGAWFRNTGARDRMIAIARIEAAHKPELESWLERILTAETLEDLFA